MNDAVQIAFALVELFEQITRNLPKLDREAHTLALGHSESARQLARMLDERQGAREQLAAACTADPTLAARLEAVAHAMPFATALRDVVGAKLEPQPLEPLAPSAEADAAPEAPAGDDE
jgi:hypothetical protein